MSLAGITHNTKIAKQLSDLISSGRFIHAFLFCGGSGEARAELGNEFAKALLCSEGRGDSCGGCISCRSFDSGNNPDLIRLSLPDGRASIGVESVAELQNRLILKPVGKKYVVLADCAELMTAAAQNKLLKTLEEPAGDTVIILLSERRDAMLDTIRSRCSVYMLEEAETAADPGLSAKAEELLRLFEQDGPYYRKKDCVSGILDNKEASKELALAFLDVFEDTAAAAAREGSTAGIYSAELAETARRQIKQGHSVPYTLKQMCLGFEARR